MKSIPQCSVPNCSAQADYRVILYDVYHPRLDVFFEQDHTCPHICLKHAEENEERAHGVREYRGCVRYPFTNKNGAQGYTIYQPLRPQ